MSNVRRGGATGRSRRTSFPPGFAVGPTESYWYSLYDQPMTWSRLDCVIHSPPVCSAPSGGQRTLMVSKLGGSKAQLSPISGTRTEPSASLLRRFPVGKGGRQVSLALTRSRPVTGSCTHLDCAFAGTHDLQAVCLQRFRTISSATVGFTSREWTGKFAMRDSGRETSTYTQCLHLLRRALSVSCRAG